MGDVIMQEWDGQVFDYWHEEHASKIDFNGVELLDFDLFSHTDWPCLSELVLEDDELQYSSSRSELLSTKEELMKIMDTEESMSKFDHGLKKCQSLSGVCEEVVNNDSSMNVESSETINGSSCIDSDGLIPCSTDSAEYKGLRLVHLVSACAEAISNGLNDLVEILLCRLKELVSPTGSTMQRVAYYLSQSLQQIHRSSVGTGDDVDPGHMFKGFNGPKDPNYMEAFSLLNQVYPYIKMAHFTANQAILEAIPAQTQKVHIIDFDIMEGMQWPPLMEALKSENCKIGHLKITAVKWDGDDSAPSSSCYTGRRLSEYATSLGIPFSFHETELENVTKIAGSNDDEIVMVNCMWELPHMCERGKRPLAGFVHGTRHLNPAILTVGSGPRGIDVHEKYSFIERFSQCLKNLCAVFDSTEAGLPEQYGLARAMVERLFLGPLLCRPINYILSHEEDQVGDAIQVMDIPIRCGFAEHDISNKNLMYAKYMVTGSNGERWYTVECEGDNELLLKWNSTSLTSVTTWRPI